MIKRFFTALIMSMFLITSVSASQSSSTPHTSNETQSQLLHAAIKIKLNNIQLKAFMDRFNWIKSHRLMKDVYLQASYSPISDSGFNIVVILVSGKTRGSLIKGVQAIQLALQSIKHMQEI